VTPSGAAPRRRGPRPGRGTTARGERTRDRLLDTAERLWGDRGVEGVSLREIRIAAGQRNSSALQFHFGDRDGLLAALAERHLPRVAALQDRLYGELVAAGRADDLAGLVEVLVRPHADYLRRGPSERAWVKVCAELAARPDVAIRDVFAHAPATALHAGTTLYEHLATTMAPALAVERIVSVSTACNHLCADRARVEDAAAPAAIAPGLMRPLLPFDDWVANLVDMAVAAMLGPARLDARPGPGPGGRAGRS
jgi:AcrR family transcriptional regulator